jgi:hypothetical protein
VKRPTPRPTPAAPSSAALGGATTIFQSKGNQRMARTNAPTMKMPTISRDGDEDTNPRVQMPPSRPAPESRRPPPRPATTREFDDDEEGIDPRLLKAAQILDEERKRSR